MALRYLGNARGWVFSDGSLRLLGDLWQFLAFLANAALFLLIGMTRARHRPASLSRRGGRRHHRRADRAVAGRLWPRVVPAGERRHTLLARTTPPVLGWAAGRGRACGGVKPARRLSAPCRIAGDDLWRSCLHNSGAGVTIGPLARRLGYALKGRGAGLRRRTPESVHLRLMFAGVRAASST